MRETDIKDKRDNIIISPGLKVRHKKSQYEYTVDSVVQEPDGKIYVMLNSPEEPRFEPEGEEGVLSDRKQSKVLYEAEPIEDVGSMYYVPDADEDLRQDDLLAVPADEFEKEYEVK